MSEPRDKDPPTPNTAGGGFRAAILALLLAAACSKASGAADPAEGARLFGAVCARCHGAEGSGGAVIAGTTIAPRNFRDPIFQSARTDADIKYVITNGKGTVMPPFKSAFKPAEIDALVAHIRSLDPRRN